MPPVFLRRAPGILAWANDGTTNPARGAFMMQGVLYAVIGPVLYQVAITGAMTQLTNGIGGSGPVRMSGNGYCLVIIIPGTNVGYTWDQADGLLPITASVFTTFGAQDLGFIDSYIVFLALNGLEIYNSDSQAVSLQGPLTFTNPSEFPREFGTDPFVAMSINHRIITCFGELTSEQYIDAGNTVGSPFVNAPNSLIQRGCVASLTVAIINQTQFWLGDDRIVYMMNGQTPQRVSNHGIENELQQANLTRAYAYGFSIGGHPFFCLTLPAANATPLGPRTFGYDCATTEWTEFETLNLGYWRPVFCVNAYGLQVVGDSQSGQLGILNTNVFTDFGEVRRAQWTTQSVYSQHNRIAHKRLECIIGGGQGTPT